MASKKLKSKADLERELDEYTAQKQREIEGICQTHTEYFLQLIDGDDMVKSRLGDFDGKDIKDLVKSVKALMQISGRYDKVSRFIRKFLSEGMQDKLAHLNNYQIDCIVAYMSEPFDDFDKLLARAEAEMRDKIKASDTDKKPAKKDENIGLTAAISGGDRSPDPAPVSVPDFGRSHPAPEKNIPSMKDVFG